MLNTKKMLLSRSFEKPDERREFRSNGYVDLLGFEDGTLIGRGVFKPGWKWSSDVKPIAGTKSCESTHTGYCLKGEMVVRMDSGEEFRIRAGEVFHILPGHDAYVVGNETCELIDTTGFGTYAKGKAEEEKKIRVA